MSVLHLVKNHSWVGIWLLFSLFIHLGGSTCNAYAADWYASATLPEPTGIYGLGTTSLHLIDTSRKEEMTPEPDDNREIMVQVWYPTDKGATESPAPYMDELTSAAIMQYVSLVSDDLPNIWDTIPTHAIESAPPAIAAQPFPVLIFSPGFGMILSVYQALIEDIVSHGYVVAAINHPYVSGITVFPDGRIVAASDMPPETIHPILVEDIKFLVERLDSLQVNGSKLMLDAQKIGFFGHSIGGSAGVEACLQLPQGKGAMNIDGALFGESHKQLVDKPLFFMLSQTHSLMNDPTLATAWLNIHDNGYIASLQASDHNIFTDFGLILSQVLPPDELAQFEDNLGWGSIDPQLAATIVQDYILAFFDTFLKDAPAENLATIDYPEAVLEQTDSSSSYDGTWHSIGYGYLIRIENGNFTLSEISDAGILPTEQGVIRGDYLYLGQQLIGKISLSDDSGVATVNLGIEEIQLTPVVDTALPPVITKSKDPEINFEVFWHSFEEQFALFDLSKVNWQATYRRYRPLIHANTTDKELFTILKAMIKPLNDGHTSITDEVSGRSFVSGPTPPPFWTGNTAAFYKIIASSMDNGVLTSKADGLIQYGTLGGRIGYLNVSAFAGYAGPEAGVEEDRLTFEWYIDTVMAELENMDALIIDIRFNGGGFDDLALALASRFTEQKRLAFSKRVRIGSHDELSSPREQFFEPAGVSFLNKPVILLTSKATMSAAEVFAMAMTQLDWVTLIGETTYGAFSNILDRSLPNGWSFGLSNQRYSSWEGIDYEQLGISPDIKIKARRPAIRKGGDNMLNAGVRALQRTARCAKSPGRIIKEVTPGPCCQPDQDGKNQTLNRFTRSSSWTAIPATS